MVLILQHHSESSFVIWFKVELAIGLKAELINQIYYTILFCCANCDR